MAKHIEVRLLDGDFTNKPKFLAKLTQRGHEVTGIKYVQEQYEKDCSDPFVESLMELPHSTLRRMNYFTFAIVGLSTKAVSQLRTHATRLTFVSTSTQYSDFSGVENAFLIPRGLDKEKAERLEKAYALIHKTYSDLIQAGVSKDTASYLLPQGLRKTLIVSGHLDAWGYVLSTRLCKRNTPEVQEICKKIWTIFNSFDPALTIGMAPSCYTGPCRERHLTCGKPFGRKDFEL